jgi:hypothetical protein
MSNLSFDIQDMLEAGFAPKMIAQVLEVPLSWIYEEADVMFREDTTSTEDTEADQPW